MGFIDILNKYAKGKTFSSESKDEFHRYISVVISDKSDKPVYNIYNETDKEAFINETIFHILEKANIILKSVELNEDPNESCNRYISKVIKNELLKLIPNSEGAILIKRIKKILTENFKRNRDTESIKVDYEEIFCFYESTADKMPLLRKPKKQTYSEKTLKSFVGHLFYVYGGELSAKIVFEELQKLTGSFSAVNLSTCIELNDEQSSDDETSLDDFIEDSNDDDESEDIAEEPKTDESKSEEPEIESLTNEENEPNEKVKRKINNFDGLTFFDLDLEYKEFIKSLKGEMRTLFDFIILEEDDSTKSIETALDCSAGSVSTKKKKLFDYIKRYCLKNSIIDRNFLQIVEEHRFLLKNPKKDEFSENKRIEK